MPPLNLHLGCAETRAESVRHGRNHLFRLLRCTRQPLHLYLTGGRDTVRWAVAVRGTSSAHRSGVYLERRTQDSRQGGVQNDAVILRSPTDPQTWGSITAAPSPLPPSLQPFTPSPFAPAASWAEPSAASPGSLRALDPPSPTRRQRGHEWERG